MNELLSLIKTSKTAKSGVTTIILGILLLFGITDQSAPETIDGLGTLPANSRDTAVGVGALLSGLIAIKGRGDAQKRINDLEHKD